jgi:hypothetical protein
VKRESAAVRAERIIAAELQAFGWTSSDMELRLKSDPNKPRIAQRLRTETILTTKWIAARLHPGSPRSATTRLQEPRKTTDHSGKTNVNV